MAYKDIINNICRNIHTGLIDFDEPRSEASMPTQATSKFITSVGQLFSDYKKVKLEIWRTFTDTILNGIL